jgi:hypothetical protein
LFTPDLSAEFVSNGLNMLLSGNFSLEPSLG